MSNENLSNTLSTASLAFKDVTISNFLISLSYKTLFTLFISLFVTMLSRKILTALTLLSSFTLNIVSSGIKMCSSDWLAFNPRLSRKSVFEFNRTPIILNGTPLINICFLLKNGLDSLTIATLPLYLSFKSPNIPYLIPACQFRSPKIVHRKKVYR